MRTVYIAAPIDRAGHEGYAEEAALVARILSEQGWVAFLPTCAWVTSELDLQVSSTIWNVNEEARSRADALIAIVDHNMVSAGVPVEIALSLQQNKPVLLVDLSEQTRNYGAIMGHFLNILPRLVLSASRDPAADLQRSLEELGL